MKSVSCLLAAGVCIVCAQTAPVVLPRGIVNAFIQAPAPSTVGRGGIVQINGLNLGPPAGAQAPGSPLPTQLGDVQVLINGSPAPLFSVSPGTILAQVPVDAAVGVADLVVQTSSGSSPAAHFTIAAAAPSIRTADGSGYGLPWGTIGGATLQMSGSGLGPTNPALANGVSGAATPTAPLVAFVGGLSAPATATAATAKNRVGEFGIQIIVPTGARPGDLISVTAGNRPANLTTYQTMKAPTVSFLPTPDGTPDLQTVTATDLNGNFLVATAARDGNGCFAGVLFDFRQQAATPIPDCLTAAARNPMVAAAGGNTLGALIGPPQGTPPAAISSTVEIFGPALDAPVSVTLPTAVSALAPAAGGNLCAVAPGPPAPTMLIDPAGNISNQACGAGGAVAMAGAAIIPNLDVNGLTVQLSAATALGQGRSAVLVGDSADTLGQAAFAIVNQAGAAVLAKPFPGGWLPLLAPAPLTVPGAPPTPAPRFRTVSFLDATGRLFYALASNSDNSKQSFVAFPLDQSDAALAPIPDGWFVAACVANIAVVDLQLSNSKVLAGSRNGAIGATATCNADGFLQLDLTHQTVTAFPLPSQAQMDVRGLASLNDYIYSYNPTAGRGATLNTVYIFDGASGSLVAPLAPPSSITGFTALEPIPELNWLVTEATNKTAGDGGLLVFDLDNQVVNVLPLPDGFDSVTEQGTYPATRKVVAIGLRSGGRGSQMVIYDLVTGDFAIAPNPQGVAFIGSRTPARPGGTVAGAAAPPSLVSANTNANTISAIALDASGGQVGVLVVRIP